MGSQGQFYTYPHKKAPACAGSFGNGLAQRRRMSLERETGIEPATFSLGIYVVVVNKELVRSRR
jgi:hypothetical protein